MELESLTVYQKAVRTARCSRKECVMDFAKTRLREVRKLKVLMMVVPMEQSIVKAEMRVVQKGFPTGRSKMSAASKATPTV